MPRYYVRLLGTNDKALDEIASRLQTRPRYSRAGYSICGLAEKDELTEFEGRGFIVEKIPEQPSISWLEPSAQSIQPFTQDPLPPAYANIATETENRYIIQFAGPL